MILISNKKFFVLLALVIVIVSIAGCSGKEADLIVPQETPTPKVTTEPVPTVVTTPTSTPIPTATAKLVPTSFTTGLPFDGEYLPIIVSIENSPAARPQLGLQTADIVYEIPVEGSVTRFLCVFSDNVPEK